MKKFLRFGEIPKNGKSINFLKMTNDQVDNFSFCAEIGDMEQAYEYVPVDAFEPGLSVFCVSQDGFPVIENMRLIISLCARLDEPVYIVTGEETGEGNDGEPLVEIDSVKPVEIAKDRLVSLVLDTLKQGFAKAEYDDSMDFERNEINAFYTTGVEEFCFNGWTFSDPVSGFDSSTGIKRRG